MAEELVYTSAQRGLRPGTRGFCTVAYTRDMSPQLVQLLEALSAYRDPFAVHDPRFRLSPIAFTHYQYTVSGATLALLSRVAPTMPDHTARSNKIAHHVVLRKRELPDGGPAWLAMQEGFFLEQWNEEPRYLDGAREIPSGDSTNTFAETWQEVMGDAGWAGVLAYTVLRRATGHVTIVFEPGMPTLKLLAEAMALLEVERRWSITFSTYFTALPAGARCQWRCCLPDAECIREARRNPQALIIDLTRPSPVSDSNALVLCAREGTPVARVPRSEPVSPGNSGTPFVRLANSQRSRLRMRP